MEKRVICIALLICLLCLLISCDGREADDVNNLPRDGFTLTAIVQNVGERIEVEVVESDYAYGIYWVITPPETVYLDQAGNPIAREDLHAGDRVKITYGGQVMMSYPPQIVAARIQKSK